MTSGIGTSLRLLVAALAVLVANAVYAGGPVDCTPVQNANLDGENILADFAGAAMVLQNNPTGFGDQFTTTAEPSIGSELNELYFTNDSDTLYFGITGNLSPEVGLQNTMLLFIQTPSSLMFGDLVTADITGAPALIGMDGVTLDFGPNYCITITNTNGTFEGLLHDLSDPMSVATPLTEGVDFSVNNSNQSGVDDIPASDPFQQEINAANNDGTGFEIAVSAAALGVNPANFDFLQVQALIANGAGFVSNQSLPPIAATDPFLGDGGGVGCLGIDDPTATPPAEVSFFTFPSINNVFINLNPSGSAPGGSQDGMDIPADFGMGNRIALQNNYTCFGDAAPFSPTPSDGSEIDQLFVASDGAKLYLGATGNVPPQDGLRNSIIFLVDVNDGFGVNTLPTDLAIDGGGPLLNLSNTVLPAGFNPRWAVQYYRENGAPQAIVEDLAFNGTEIAPLFTVDGTVHTDPARNAFGSDLSNLMGVNNIAGDDPIQQAMLAETAVDGVQFSLRLTGGAVGESLGYDVEADPGIKVMAFIASGSGFISNQFLPPLNPTTGEVRMSNDTVSPALTISDATVDLVTTVLSNQTAANATANSVERVTDIAVTVDITHPNMEDLTIDLFHAASNTTVRLWDGNVAGANMQTTFAVGGADLATWTAPGNTGTFEVNDPVNDSLLDFNGIDPTDGDWTLFITDNVVGGGTGTLNSWSISLEQEVGGGVGCIGNRDPDTNPLDLPAEFPGATTVDFTVGSLLGDGAPNFGGGNSPGTNIPSAYAAAAVATQNNHTCFGDAQDAGLPIVTGNELDAMYVENTIERIQFGIAGNLQPDPPFGPNGYVLLIDSIVGGETVISAGTNGDAIITGLNGTVMDAGFTPDFALGIREELGGFRVDFADLQNDTIRLLGNGGFESGSGLLNPPGINEGGSELDEMFVQNDADNLYVGLTGNLEGNGNPLVLFLDTANTGAGLVLATAGAMGVPGVINDIDGEILTAGPNGDGPEYALVLTRSGDFFDSATLVNLSTFATTSLPFAAEVPMSDPLEFVLAPNTFVGSNANVDGVNGDDSVPPAQQEILAATAESGVIFSIDRASLGSPANGSAIGLCAGITSPDGFWSNQFLPGISNGINNSPNVGNANNMGGVDLATAGQTFQSYTLSGTPSQPSTYNGLDIPTAMAGGANPLTTQNNSTGFGNRSQEAFDNSGCTQVAVSNVNLEGVTGCECFQNNPPCLGGGLELAGLVDTGVEIDIALSEIGLGPVMAGNEPTIRVLAILTGGTGFLSNQTLPGVGGMDGDACNLGFMPDFTMFDGDQFFTYTLTADAGGFDGDIDGDGDVDMADYDALASVLVGNVVSEPEFGNSDVNNDGERNGLDIAAYLDIVLP